MYQFKKGGQQAISLRRKKCADKYQVQDLLKENKPNY